ncbi:MAG: hypothetical protein ACRBG0_01430 [Lewinella sp.]|uniref:hypothetical protein n=1 Tax=Lewinella sp. TaxID=2004506 RepID=UPI003D6A63AB
MKYILILSIFLLPNSAANSVVEIFVVKAHSQVILYAAPWDQNSLKRETYLKEAIAIDRWHEYVRIDIDENKKGSYWYVRIDSKTRLYKRKYIYTGPSLKFHDGNDAIIDSLVQDSLIQIQN